MGSWEWDVTANEVFSSDELLRIHGLPKAERPRTYEDYLERAHPEDRQRIDETVKSGLRRPGPYVLEYRIVRPDGDISGQRLRGS